MFLVLSAVLLISLVLGCSKLGNPSPSYTIPTVSSVTPSNGAINVALGANITVTFSETMNETSAQNAFKIVDQSGNSVSGNFGSWSGNTMTFTPENNFSYDTVYTCTVGVGAVDSSGDALASAYTWSFTSLYSDDTTPPTISSVTPSPGAINVATSPTISVTWSEGMDKSSAQNAFTMKDSSKKVVSGSVSWIGNIMIYTPSTALAANTTYTCDVGVNAEDLSGNLLQAEETWNFTTATGSSTFSAPTVIFTIPDNETIAIPIASTVSVGFSQTMNETSVQNAFTMTDASNIEVGGNVTWRENVMIFTPGANLDNDMVYTCAVGTGATDSVGNPMAAEHTWSFTTIYGPPTVISMIPTNNATGVSINPTISVTFSQPMDEDSFTSNTCSCSPSIGSGPSHWNADGTTLTFNPASLATNTTYTCTINGVQDQEGNYMAAPYSTSFTTGSN